MPKLCQNYAKIMPKLRNMPKRNFEIQTTSKNAKNAKFGIDNANLASLIDVPILIAVQFYIVPVLRRSSMLSV